MRKMFATILLLPLALLPCRAQTNVIYGYMADLQMTPTAGTAVTMSLISPNPKLVNGIWVSPQPVTAYTDANGFYSFKNVSWGEYEWDIAGQALVGYVGINTTGSNNVITLTTNTYAFVVNGQAYSVAAGTGVIILTNGSTLTISSSTNYDPAGSAATAQTNAQNYAATNQVTPAQLPSVATNLAIYSPAGYLIQDSAGVQYVSQGANIGQKIQNASGTRYWPLGATNVFTAADGTIHAANGTQLFDTNGNLSVNAPTATTATNDASGAPITLSITNATADSNIVVSVQGRSLHIGGLPSSSGGVTNFNSTIANTYVNKASLKDQVAIDDLGRAIGELQPVWTNLLVSLPLFSRFNPATNDLLGNVVTYVNPSFNNEGINCYNTNGGAVSMPATTSFTVCFSAGASADVVENLANLGNQYNLPIDSQFVIALVDTNTGDGVFVRVEGRDDPCDLMHLSIRKNGAWLDANSTNTGFIPTTILRPYNAAASTGYIPADFFQHGTFWSLSYDGNGGFSIGIDSGGGAFYSGGNETNTYRVSSALTNFNSVVFGYGGILGWSTNVWNGTSIYGTPCNTNLIGFIGDIHVFKGTNQANVVAAYRAHAWLDSRPVIWIYGASCIDPTWKPGTINGTPWYLQPVDMSRATRFVNMLYKSNPSFVVQDFSVSGGNTGNMLAGAGNNAAFWTPAVMTNRPLNLARKDKLIDELLRNDNGVTYSNALVYFNNFFLPVLNYGVPTYLWKDSPWWTNGLDGNGNQYGVATMMLNNTNQYNLFDYVATNAIGLAGMYDTYQFTTQGDVATNSLMFVDGIHPIAIQRTNYFNRVIAYMNTGIIYPNRKPILVLTSGTAYPAFNQTNFVSNQIYTNGIFGVKIRQLSSVVAGTTVGNVAGYQLLCDPAGGVNWQTNDDGTTLSVVGTLGMTTHYTFSDVVGAGWTFVFTNVTTGGTATLIQSLGNGISTP